jgi:hypothetical protein
LENLTREKTNKLKLMVDSFIFFFEIRFTLLQTFLLSVFAVIAFLILIALRIYDTIDGQTNDSSQLEFERF